MNDLLAPLDNLVQAIVFLRWVLVVLAAIAAGAIIAGLYDQLACERAWSEDLEQENDELRAMLRRARRMPVALPPRKGSEADHG